MKTKKIKLEDREVTVRKLPLGDYAEFFKYLQGFTQHLGNLDKLSEQQILEMLPVILADGVPETVKIIALASDLTEEQAKEIGLDEAVEIIAGIIEVNDYRKVAETIKKVLAQRTQKTKIEK